MACEPEPGARSLNSSWPGLSRPSTPFLRRRPRRGCPGQARARRIETDWPPSFACLELAQRHGRRRCPPWPPPRPRRIPAPRSCRRASRSCRRDQDLAHVLVGLAEMRLQFLHAIAQAGDVVHHADDLGAHMSAASRMRASLRICCMTWIDSISSGRRHDDDAGPDRLFARYRRSVVQIA